MSNIESLKDQEHNLWSEYEKLKAPADEAYKKYRKVNGERKELELYEKAKRQVMKELLDSVKTK